MDSLKQILEKQNHLDVLEDDGYQRIKDVRKCNKCKSIGHKCSCKQVLNEDATSITV